VNGICSGRGLFKKGKLRSVLPLQILVSAVSIQKFSNDFSGRPSLLPAITVAFKPQIDVPDRISSFILLFTNAL
jgi:hypothetical protein